MGDDIFLTDAMVAAGVEAMGTTLDPESRARRMYVAMVEKGREQWGHMQQSRAERYQQ